MACTALPTTASFASSLVDYADCQARTIGAQGYLALAAPGSGVAQLTTVLLTILIALFGYRLLLGGTPTIRDGVLTLVKIGVVVALGTGWSAYQMLVYDVVIGAPAQLARTIAAAAGLPGGGGDLAVHLDAVDQQFQLLAIESLRPLTDYPQGTAPPPLFAGFDTFALGAARVIYLTGSLGGYVATRLIAGIGLALGPLFVAFLLFDATRGLVEGWLRVLSGAALGTLATAIVLGVELALFEPWLSSLITQRAADIAISGAAAQLLAAATLFALALAAVIAAAARLTWSLRLPATTATMAAASSSDRIRSTATLLSAPDRSYPARLVTSSERSRAMAIADAVGAADRREAAFAGGMATFLSAGASSRAALASIGAPGGASDAGRMIASDPSARRRTRPRSSGSAVRRDRAS